MRHNLLLAGLALTILLGCLNRVPADDNTPKPDNKARKADDNKRDRKFILADLAKNPNVHKLTLMVGQTRTVQYFLKNASPAEQAALDELARAENEAQYADDLQGLKRRMVSNEQAMEARRHKAHMDLYGKSIETTTNATNKVTGYSPYMPVDGVGLLTPAFSGSGFRFGFNRFNFPFGLGFNRFNFPTFGAGYGTPFGPYGLGVNPADVDSYTQSTSTKVSNSLAHGMGDEGRFKGELVAQIAREATAAYASEAQQKLTTARSNVTAIMNPKARERIRPAGDDKVDVILYLKDGRQVEGVLVSEDANWMIIWTPHADVRLRTAEVTRVDALAR